MSNYKVKPNSSATSSIYQLIYNETAKADKVITTLVIPERVIADAFTSAEHVGKGSLLRVEGAADQYIWFGGSTLAAPTITDAALEMEAGFFYIIATDEFVRTSVATRIEVLED